MFLHLGIMVLSDNQCGQSPKLYAYEINNHAIRIKKNEDNSLVVFPYKNIQVELIEQENYNIYYTRENAEGKQIDFFDIAYKYRLNSSAEWIEIRESLERMN